MSLIYLAVPYSDPDPAVKLYRFDTVNRVASQMMLQGQMVFSPISQSHPIAEHGLPGDWQFWEAYDRLLLSFCTKLVVLMLPGWDRSMGVQAEIQIATEMGIPIEYMEAP